LGGAISEGRFKFRSVRGWIDCWNPRRLQDLRKNLYIKAKTEPTWRFWGLYTHVCKRETLQDDLVILVDAHPRHDWLLAAVTKRLRGEIGKLRVEINEEKSRIVDLRKGESFGFLGFDFRLVRSLKERGDRSTRLS